eukprot:7071564-Prymnesium_polylepis.1
MCERCPERVWPQEALENNVSIHKIKEKKEKKKRLISMWAGGGALRPSQAATRDSSLRDIGSIVRGQHRGQSAGPR